MSKKVMKIVFAVALVLLIVGGLNWGLIGLFNFNFVEEIFGHGSIAAMVVYVLVGISALFVAFGKLLKKKK